MFDKEVTPKENSPQCPCTASVSTLPLSLDSKPGLLSHCFPSYLPCTVGLCLAAVSLHHGPQRLPVPFRGAAALRGATRPSPPVTPPPFPLRLHGDWLTILIHEVQLLSVPVTRVFSRFGLIRGNTTNQRKTRCKKTA